ncbi:MAG: hypothetical protein J6565_02960 [Lactobacillus sp.]|nr:hypothetical protein [Lactobacillus sp.]
MADETEIKFRFTAKGQQVSAAILGGKDKIEFTKAVASIDVHINDTDADIANIVDLDNKKQIADIHDVVAVKNNIVQIPIKFEKNKITEDYQLNTIGIYAKYQDQEFLYAFGALKYPIYMHHTDDSGVFKMYTYITVGTVANVVIKTDNTESVSRDDLNKILVDYPAKADLGSLYGMTNKGAKTTFSNTVFDPNSIVETGIYKFDNCKLSKDVFGKFGISSSNAPEQHQSGWLFVIADSDFNLDPDSNQPYIIQFIFFRSRLYFRKHYNKTGLLSDTVFSLIGANLQSPNYKILGGVFNIDLPNKGGIYELSSTELKSDRNAFVDLDIHTSSFDGIIVNKYSSDSDTYGIQFLIAYKDEVIAYRGFNKIAGGSTFKRLLTSNNYTTLKNLNSRINTLEKKLL